MKYTKQFIILAIAAFLACVFWNNQTFAAQEEKAYKLKPKYLLNNFNFDMMSATVTQDEHTFVTTGNFRSNKDFDVMYWETEDSHSHPDLKYPTQRDFSNVILEYNYKISGNAALMNAETSPTLTVVTNDNQAYYIRLWNYVVDRPQEKWEGAVSEELEINYSFPVGRTAGQANGTEGKIRIDFNNLYSGWVPFVQSDESVWLPNQEWVKVPVTDIKRLEWAFVPNEYNYDDETMTYLADSSPFEVKFTNWNVYGNSFLMNEAPYAAVGAARICDSYDDSYDQTPERLASDYSKLGFGGFVDFYVGASHYYDKRFSEASGDMEIIKDRPFNQAFTNWYDSYVKQLAARDMNVVSSISMESVDAPANWWQRTWDGKAAETLWSPAPKLLSFTNEEVKSYYRQYVLGLEKIYRANKQIPMVQLGEPWWWYMDSLPGSPPTFYDQSTRDLYYKQSGQSMHEFKSAYDDTEGHEGLLSWLSEQNGKFSLMLRDALKSADSSAQFAVLLFIPTVVDQEMAPAMMSVVNFPIEQWKSPNLDFFMIEDYDYLTSNNMEKHRQAMTLVQRKLNYSPDKIHYLSGADSTNNDSIWRNIDQAINDGINMKFAQVYLWAYPQVKNRGWKQPTIISSSVPPGLHKENVQVKLSSENVDSIIYTLDGREPSLSTGQLYDGSAINITKDTRIKAVPVKNGVVGSSVQFDYLFNRAQYKYDTFNKLLQWYTYFQDEQKYRMTYSYDQNGNLTKRVNNKIFNMWGDQNIVPVMSDNVSPDGTASASSNFGPSYAPFKAFDHLDLEQAWITNGVVEGWISFKFPTPKHVISYKILPRNEESALAASPKSWTFEGFDGTKWVVLSSESNVTNWKTREFKSFNVNQSSNYQEYRINIVENNGHWYTSIGEIEMMEGDDITSPTDYNIIPAMISNESSGGIAKAESEFGEGYAAFKAFDHMDSEQSWITNGTVQGWLSYEFPLPKLVRSYKITPRYDESTLTSAPKSWTFEGFNGTEWRVLATETDVTNWHVSEAKTFSVKSPGVFNKYRLNISDNNGHWWTSVGELEMMQ